MARTARTIDDERIMQLREQIDDPGYVDGAVDRLAGRITARLLGLEREDPQPIYRFASSSRNENAAPRRDEE